MDFANLIGRDVCLDIFGTLHKKQENYFKPPIVLEDLVKAGKLDRKSGEGFYKH